MRDSLIIFLLVLCFNGFAQLLTIEAPESKLFIDVEHEIILLQLTSLEEYDDLADFTSIEIIFNSQIFDFIEIPNSLEFSSSYIVENNEQQFELFITNFPIISIHSDNEIINDPKVLADFSYVDDHQTFTSKIGIELRGGSALEHAKKTFDIELWEDDEGDDKLDHQFGALREDDDWILDALHNEPLRIRSFLSHKLWLDMHWLSYAPQEPKAKSGADVMYVEVFLNGNYNGIYLLSEQVDRKLLKLKKYEDEIRGELYKGVWWGATTFTDLPFMDNNLRNWGGHEMKYPKKDDITDWRNLYDFTDFVINSDDVEFSSEIYDKVEKRNYLDYFIFLNLLRATDNTGKNIYTAKYNSDGKYFYVPWDLDGTWGNNWEGAEENITNDILRNGLYNRLLELNPPNTRSSLRDNWLYHRQNSISNEDLEERIESALELLIGNNVYERESIIYPEFTYDELSKNYLLSWLENRLVFLDEYFTNELILSNSEHFIENELLVFPNPLRGYINLVQEPDLLNKAFCIYDFQGKIIDHGQVPFSLTIDIRSIPKGIYLLAISSRFKKILIE